LDPKSLRILEPGRPTRTGRFPPPWTVEETHACFIVRGDAQLLRRLHHGRLINLGRYIFRIAQPSDFRRADDQAAPRAALPELLKAVMTPAPGATGGLAGAERVATPDVADACKTTYLNSEDLQMTKPIDALKTIARYVEAKKPKTLAEAEHMLELISVMADETVLDEDAAESSLAKRLISEPFFP
jgi:hypothetical protein